MKLVDFLIEELKEWPGRAEFIADNRLSIAAFGADRYCEDLDLPTGKLMERGGMVTKCEWQASVDALNAPKVVEWAKGSLPPIGSVVEWDGCTFAPEEPKEKDLHVGDQVTIIAHLKDVDFEIAAFTFNPSIHNAARGSVWVNQGAHGCFRPIRTDEQVAAEERESAIKEMITLVGGSSRRSAEALYDAGYRKQVAK